jgi:hypothetical protein
MTRISERAGRQGHSSSHSGATRHCLRLLSHVPALAFSNQLYLPCESCQLYMTMFRGIKSAATSGTKSGNKSGTKSAPRHPKQGPPENASFNCKAYSSRNMAWPRLENIFLASLINLWSFASSPTRHCLTASPLATPNLLAHCSLFC